MSGTTNSDQGGSFWDVGLKDLVGTVVGVYDKERERSRVGSGGDQSQTSTQATSPAPVPVAAPRYDGLELPTWAKTLLVVSGAVLIGALAWRAVR